MRKNTIRQFLGVVLALLLLASPLYPQTATSSPDQMQTLFERVQHAIDVMNEGCSSDECASASAGLATLVDTAKSKHSSNSLVGVERNKFLDDLVKQFTVAQIAVTHEQQREEDEKKMAEAVKCKPNPLGMTQCQQCDYVYKASLAICSLYALGGCRLCAIACVLVATRSYTICIKAYCS